MRCFYVIFYSGLFYDASTHVKQPPVLFYVIRAFFGAHFMLKQHYI